MKETSSNLQKSCYVCQGIAFYTRSMYAEGKKPYCLGKETKMEDPYEIQAFKERIQIEKQQTIESKREVTLHQSSPSWWNPLALSNHNVQWNYLHLPSNTSPQGTGSLRRRKDVYITPLQYLFLRPPDNRKFIIYCFGKTTYEETFNGKTNLVPDVLHGFYHIRWKETREESASTSIELSAGDFWIPSQRNKESTTIHTNDYTRTAAATSSSTQRAKQYRIQDTRKPTQEHWLLRGLKQYRNFCDNIAFQMIEKTKTTDKEVRKTVSAWQDRHSKR